MSNQPRLEFDPALPISAEATRIAELIQDNQVVIVAGETGSGKTTQLPKICMLAGRERVAHTQPRRIAARTVAERIADECGVELGAFVGYQVRFTRKASRETRIKVMTDGILLNELTHDRMLHSYDTIIIDEAHERSLNIDFLLGYVKQLLRNRPDLRVIVTSATIDTGRFSEHFDDAPIVEVSGRTYPVEVRYRPPEEEEDELDALPRAIIEIATEPGGGDVLVFLTGEREIRDAADAIEGLGLDWEVLPLYARLSAAEQRRVFQQHKRRRVVLATNVAETSITVPGIRYVIDAGLARISRYSARTKVQRLPIEPVSRASADQRAGRCGRLGPGVAIRLYSEEDFEARDEFTQPEILRTNLATVILLMAQAGLGDVESFPFVEPPVASQINDGLRVLRELGATHPRRGKEEIRLTRIGHQLARMPVDPRMGRMLLEAARRNCLAQVQILVAGLTIPDIRERPTEHQERADQLHRRFWGGVPGRGEPKKPDGAEPLRHTVHTGTRPEQDKASAPEGGDFEVLLNLWSYLRRRRRELSGNAFRRLCRDEYLHFLRFREWQDLVTQLKVACRELDLGKPTDGAMPDVLTSLLAGLLSQIGLAENPEPATRPQKGRGNRRRKPLVEYQGARGARFAIQPGSSLRRATPPLVMANELVETSRLWARTVAAIRPEWVESVAGDLVTRTLSEPRWRQRTGTIVASEAISLFGVPLVSGRTVNFANQDPELAREIFIRTGLVEQEWQTRQPLVVANRDALAEATTLTDRMRRPDLLIGDEDLFRFWDERLPATVFSAATFEKWARQLEDDSALRRTPADYITDPGQVKVADYPDRWETDGHSLAVKYVFEPGTGHDGVFIEVPLTILPVLDPAPFTWQVPGLRRELATALLRSLPKRIRTNFVPAPDWAASALDWLQQHPREDESLPTALARALKMLTGELIDPADWQPDAVPGHLRATFIVTDGATEVQRGTDLALLAQQLAPKARAKMNRSAKQLVVEGQRDWTFGTISNQIRLAGGAVGYPGLVDEGSTVGLAVAESQQLQQRRHFEGLRRLLTLTNPSPIKWVVAHMSNVDKLALGASSYPSVPDLLADAWLKASGQLLLQESNPSQIRDEKTYREVAGRVRSECAPRTGKIVATAAQALAVQAELQPQFARLDDSDPLRKDVAEQLANLTFNRFISNTPDPWYDRLPTYLKAILVRLTAAAQNRARDDRGLAQIEDVEEQFAQLCDEQPPGPLPADVEEIAFLIEELRISLFAQSLGTAIPVSVKRVRQAMTRIRASRN